MKEETGINIFSFPLYNSDHRLLIMLLDAMNFLKWLQETWWYGKYFSRVYQKLCICDKNTHLAPKYIETSEMSQMLT